MIIYSVFGEADNAARVAFFALYALQHRGQESAGIATSFQHSFHVHKGMGLVSQVFTEEVMAELPGKLAIGHTRYSTAGWTYTASIPRNPQRNCRWFEARWGTTVRT